MYQEIEQEIQLNRIDDKSRDTNPYKELIVNNAEKIEPLLTQMEQWSRAIHSTIYNMTDIQWTIIASALAQWINVERICVQRRKEVY